VAAADTEHCAYHRRRPKVTTCGTCGNPICADCIVRTGVGIKCRSCTGVKAAKPSRAAEEERTVVTPAPAPTPAGTRASAGAGRKPWAVPLVAVGVVVLLVAGYGLVSRGSGTKATDDIQASAAPEATERVTEFVGAGRADHPGPGRP